MNKKNLLKYESNKLFYNNYLYCLNASNRLGFIFRNKNFYRACGILDTLQQDYENGKPLIFQRSLRYSLPIPERDFLDSRTIYNELTRYTGDYLMRIQNSCINFYSNDRSFLESLENKLENTQYWKQPAKEHIDFISGKKNTILVNDDTYAYKITFNANKFSCNFTEWLDSNSDKIKISDYALWSIKDRSFAPGSYMFVTTKNVLLLVQMINGNCIARIDKLVCKHNIDK